MRLRKQLFFASLFTLSLPWVGCQYVQEMQTTLLEGQAEALQATAMAIAATIESDAGLSGLLTQSSSSADATSLYLHPFHSPLILDGYEEDWVSYAYTPQIFPSLVPSHIDAGKLAFYGGLRGNQAWLFFRIPSEQIDYYNPSQNIRAAHGVQLGLISEQGQKRERRIVAASPGQALAFAMDETPLQRDHQIKGVWREWIHGFQLELQLPLSMLADGLRFDIIPPDNHAKINSHVNATTHPKTPQRYSNVRFSNDSAPHFKRHDIPPKIMYQQDDLNAALSIFLREGINIKLANTNTALVASTGKLNVRASQPSVPWLLSLLYQFALDAERYAALPQPQLTGFLDHTEVSQSLAGQPARNRYAFGGRTVSTVSVPVHVDGHVVGAVYIEQNAENLSGFTDQAFSRLLLYSIAVSVLSALVLVMYASWLSFRILRLSRSAASAISETGNITDAFKCSNVNDEIGDLSRSFALLLTRLKEYTHYLKTLSSKLSHELRTPLAIVSSSLDNLVEQEALPKQAKIYAQRAKEGSARLSGILNAMNAASRVEQAIGSAEFEPVSLIDLLSNLIAAYSDVYPDAQFHLNAENEQEKYVVEAAGELLVQMLDKLTDNAADFCPPDGDIKLGLRRQHDTVTITVQNDGPLLPDNMHNQLFDSLVSLRAHSDTPSKNSHLGLGLYIVRLIVECHCGAVRARNREDSGGVVFEVELPIQRPGAC